MTEQRGGGRRRDEPTVEKDRDIHFERIIIARVMIDPDSYYDLSYKLLPEHFTVARHQRIWRAMAECVEKNVRPTLNMLRFRMGPEDREESTDLQMFSAMIARETKDADYSQFGMVVDAVVRLGNRRELVTALQKLVIDVQAMDPDTSLDDMKDEIIRATGGVATSTGDKDLRSYGDWGEELAGHVSESHRNGGTEGIGLKVGLESVEEVMGRLLPGKIYVIAGMSGGGKSAITKHITEAAALDAKEKGRGWGYMASMEMQGMEQASRSMAEYLGLPSYKIENALLKDSEVEMIVDRGVRYMQGIPIMLDQRRRMNFEDIRTRMRKVRLQKGGLSFALIDHLLLIKAGSRESAAERMMASVIEAKGLAGEFDIPIILLSQVDEKAVMASARKEPNATNLFGSQGIKQNSDAVCFVHRPEVVMAAAGPNSQRESDIAEHAAKLIDAKGKAFFYSDKGRGRESNVRRELLFDGATMSFREPYR